MITKELRDEFSACSTGSQHRFGLINYYGAKCYAVNAFDVALQNYDFCLDSDDLADFIGDTGRKTIAVHDRDKHVVCYAILIWYKMSSGNYEFLGYLT